MTTTSDTGRIASELRNVIGRLVRRLRAEHRFPLTHGAVLGDSTAKVPPASATSRPAKG